MKNFWILLFAAFSFLVLFHTYANEKKPEIQFEEGLVEGVDKSKDFSNQTAKTQKSGRSDIYDRDLGFGRAIKPTLQDMRYDQ